MTKITFGTIIIDKLHQFFGSPDPVACIVASAWENEKDDGENQEVWIDHYRGHIKRSYADLRDPIKWKILDKKVNPSKNVLKQLKQAAEEYKKAKTMMENLEKAMLL